MNSSKKTIANSTFEAPPALIDSSHWSISIGGLHVSYRNPRARAIKRFKEAPDNLISSKICLGRDSAFIGSKKSANFNGFEIFRSIYSLPSPEVVSEVDERTKNCLKTELEKRTLESKGLNTVIRDKCCKLSNSIIHSRESLFRLFDPLVSKNSLGINSTVLQPLKCRKFEVSRDYDKAIVRDEMIDFLTGSIIKLFGARIERPGYRDKEGKKSGLQHLWEVRKSKNRCKFLIKLYDKHLYWRLEVVLINPKFAHMDDREFAQEELFKEIMGFYGTGVEILDQIHTDLNLPKPVTNVGEILDVFTELGFKNPSNNVALVEVAWQSALCGTYSYEEARKNGVLQIPGQGQKDRLLKYGFWDKGSKTGVFSIRQDFRDAPKRFKEDNESKGSKSNEDYWHEALKALKKFYEVSEGNDEPPELESHLLDVTEEYSSMSRSIFNSGYWHSDWNKIFRGA